MPTKDNTTPTNEKLYLALTVIFFITSAVLGYLLYQEKQTVTYVTQQNIELDTEKQQVEQELEQMLLEYETMETENLEMQQQIEEQKTKIEDLLQKAKNNNWTIAKLKKETETLRNIMQGFVRTIDSLNTANLELMAKNQEVNQQLKTKESELSELSKEKKALVGKVELGSRIQALDIAVTPQQVKRNDVARESKRANKVDQLKCCFTMNENPIAKSGRKIIHLRIIDPNGNVLAKEDNTENMFKFEGVEGLYSSKMEIIYDNDELDVCLFWEKNIEEMELPSGIYIVEIYIEDYLAGKTTIELI